MYIALLMINKSLYVILDAYRKLVLQDQICLLLELFLDFLLLHSSPLQYMLAIIIMIVNGNLG